jgi:hypothetical protein
MNPYQYCLSFYKKNNIELIWGILLVKDVMDTHLIPLIIIMDDDHSMLFCYYFWIV